MFDRQGDWSWSHDRFGRYLNFRVFYDAPSQLGYCYHHVGCNFQFAHSPYTIDLDAVRQENMIPHLHWYIYQSIYEHSQMRIDYHYGTQVKRSVRVGDQVVFLHAFAYHYSFQSSEFVTEYRARLIAGITTISGFNYRGIPNTASTTWSRFYNHGWNINHTCPSTAGGSIRCTGAFRDLATVSKDINNDGNDDVLLFTFTQIYLC
ncbi:hypothetical protein GEMRC1_008605 [Eukaryota sp. GEM-RC1]